MKDFPVLSTDRLLLRQFRMSDAPDVQRLAGAEEIAKGTLIPHPYEDGIAEEWIESQREAFEKGKQVNFAIVLAGTGELIGSVGLSINRQHQRAQIGYWIGVPYWNRGYCTEAVRAVLDYGLNTLDLHRIWAPHFRSNPASGRVLQKVGMKYEGRLRDHYLRFGDHEDAEVYGVLKGDYATRKL